MTKKMSKTEPANLTTHQKDEIKKQIYQKYPTLSMFSEQIEMLIEEYNKDKKFVSKLMKNVNPITQVVGEANMDTDTKLIEVVKADTPRWKDIVEKMEKSKTEFVQVFEDTEDTEGIQEVQQVQEVQASQDDELSVV